MPSKPYIYMNFEIQGGRPWAEFLELMCLNAHTQPWHCPYLAYQAFNCTLSLSTHEENKLNKVSLIMKSLVSSLSQLWHAHVLWMTCRLYLNLAQYNVDGNQSLPGYYLGKVSRKNRKRFSITYAKACALERRWTLNFPECNVAKA